MSELGSVIEFSQDLNEVEAPRSLPAGDYPATIMGAELTTSKNTGKPMVKVDFRVTPEDFPADYEDADSFADGKTVTTYITVEAQNRASMFRVKRFCESIGAPLGRSLNVNDWVGKRAMITLSVEEFEGIERERFVRAEQL